MIVASMLIPGFGSGASLQVAVYLLSRFAGDSFGRIFGVVSALLAVAAGVGPWIFGTAFSAFGSYDPVLIASVPICIVCGALIASLGPTPR